MMEMAGRNLMRSVVAGVALACALATTACSGGDGERRTASATGTITEVEASDHRARTGTEYEDYRFVVSFEDEDHVRHVARAGNKESKKRWSEGDTVLVRYDARDPEGSCSIEYVTPKPEDSRDGGSETAGNGADGSGDAGTDATDASTDGGNAETDPDDNPIAQLVHEKTNPTEGSK